MRTIKSTFIGREDTYMQSSHEETQNIKYVHFQEEITNKITYSNEAFEYKLRSNHSEIANSYGKPSS